MSSQYHIRIRGRVHGPFDTNKLRQLVRKGQLGRMHEISTDGHTWTSASTIAELFQSDGSSTKSSAGTKTEQGDREPSAGGPVSAAAGEWFYSLGEGSIGPCAFSTIQELATNGRLGPDDKVWLPDRSEWVDARELSELAFRSISRSSTRSRDDADASGEGDSVVSRLGDAVGTASGWKLFASLWCILIGVGNVIVGLVGLRASGTSQSLVPGAIGALIGGVLFGLVGALLLNAHAKINAAAIAPSPASIRDALKAEGRFWTCVGLILLMTTVLVILAAICMPYLPSPQV